MGYSVTILYEYWGEGIPLYGVNMSADGAIFMCNNLSDAMIHT